MGAIAKIMSKQFTVAESTWFLLFQECCENVTLHKGTRVSLDRMPEHIHCGPEEVLEEHVAFVTGGDCPQAVLRLNYFVLFQTCYMTMQKV